MALEAYYLINLPISSLEQNILCSKMNSLLFGVHSINSFTTFGGGLAALLKNRSSSALN